MTEELQLVRDIKIGALLGDSPEQARPRRAPFYRSSLTMAVAKANLESVYQLFEKGDFLSALPSDDAWLLQSIRFELDQAVRNLEAAGPDLAAALRDEDKRRLIALAIISINGTGETIGDYYTERTGLAIGFNSLDGD